MIPRRHRMLLVVALTALVVVVYQGSLSGDFVYDDHRFVANNPALGSPGNFLAFFTDPSTVDPEGNWEGIYRPLRTLDYALDHFFFGTNPVGYRIHSLLIHVATSLALSVLLFRLLGRLLPAFLLGCMYAVHPVHVESVAWVTSRADVLSGLFSMVALLAMRRRGPLWVGVSTAVFGLALFAKESAAVVPLIGLILDFLLPERRERPGWKNVLRWLPSLGILVAYLVIRQGVLEDFTGQRPPWGGSRWCTLEYMVVGTGWYLWRLVLPLGFRFDYQLQDFFREWAFPTLEVLFLIHVFLAVVGTVVLVRMRGRTAVVWAGAGWFLLALGPVSNVLVPINILVAERFLYVPAGGAFLALGGVALGVVRRWPAMSRALGVTALVWLGFLGATTYGFAGKWSGEEALWQSVLDHSPGHFRAYHGLAKARILDRDYPGARRALVKAMGFAREKYPELYFDLGRCYQMEARYREAAAHFRMAVNLWRTEGKTAKDMRYLQTLVGLEDLYRRLGDEREANRMMAWLEDARSGHTP